MGGRWEALGDILDGWSRRGLQAIEPVSARQPSKPHLPGVSGDGALPISGVYWLYIGVTTCGAMAPVTRPSLAVTSSKGLAGACSLDPMAHRGYCPSHPAS